MKTVFISLPMRGRSEDQIKADMAQAAKVIMQRFGPFQLLDTFFRGREGTSPIECLGESIKYLSQADVAVFLSGWEGARGCRVEHTVCVEYQIPILYL